MTQPCDRLRFSLVVPIFDEVLNVASLFAELVAVLEGHGPFEVIAVDDGSRDGSLEAMRDWKQQNGAGWLRIIALERNRGQSAAVMAGVEAARAGIVATIDGDQQNDPRDIPAMLNLVEVGEADAVVGVRRARRDTFSRRMSSRIGNVVRNWVTGDRATDAACGIKAVRRELFLRVPKFVGMHRFMPTLVRSLGGKVVEMDVNHRPRAAGVAKYGIGNRIWRGLLDCLAVRWQRSRVLLHRVKEEN